MAAPRRRNGDLPAPLRGMSPGLHMLAPDAETWHVMVADTARGRLYVLYDATDHEARVREFGLIVLGMGALCTIAAYALSRRVSGIAVGPLLDLTNRLSEWAPGSPEIEITRDDEAGRLIEAFNRVQNQVDRSIAREREFAANLSHEARTQLAAIRSDSEIMQLNPAMPADAQPRLERIVANVDHIVSSLESVRAIASDESRPAEPVDLAACMDDAWRGLEGKATPPDSPSAPRPAGRGAHAGPLCAPDGAAQSGAQRHRTRRPGDADRAAHGRRALELRDTGQGIAAEELPFIFQRYYADAWATRPARRPTRAIFPAGWAWPSPSGCAMRRAGNCASDRSATARTTAPVSRCACADRARRGPPQAPPSGVPAHLTRIQRGGPHTAGSSGVYCVYLYAHRVLSHGT
ncbi:sensor histidine kinase [Achromobacter sp. DMS1]|uniref:sensor histidine kinase n=1 Tax=Achromobacter sp. DMS1 TaxID=1688405 RepID=UPI000A707FF1